ncbi:flagellar hook-length control protein FliK [Ruminiclostridium cellobioparum]|uniref:flagellar hook-length control protein FliK n=1 Tax=Ruminiclostridium cellobioparum TaxID=29355 RepID=UPI000481AC60|nr:flagellar hook-length control protein FliK [Ruminiclostridium cellobioparum]
MRIDSFTSAAANTTYNGSDIMGKLKPGDNVRVQILENSGSELTLKFSDGTVVSGAAAAPVEAAEGEFVNLTFKGFVDGRPAFDVAEKATQPQTDKAFENIRNVLTALKLPLTEQNLQIAQALTRQNLPVTQENMAKMTGLLKENAGLKPNEAAFLTASKLSEDTNNIDKLQSLLAGRLKLSNDISELAKLVDSRMKGSADLPADASAVNRLVQKIAASLAEKGELTAKAGEEIKNQAVQNNGTPAAAGQDQAKASANTAENGRAPDISANTRPAVGTAGQGEAGEAVVNNKTNSGETGQTAKPAQSGAEGAGKAVNDQVSSPVKANTSEIDTAPRPGNLSAETGDKADIARNHAQTENSGLNSTAEKLLNMLKGETPSGKSELTLLNAFNKELTALMNSGKLPGEELAAAKQLAGEERVSAAAVKTLESLFVRIDETSQNIDPVRLYKEMDGALQTLKSTLQLLPQGIREAAGTIVNNLESNVNFINQLNNYSSYVQLPLSIFNQNTTGELYMLKKGSRSKKLDPSNMTVLISLDSNNIGRIDTLLSVDRRNISTNFRLENSEVFPVLKEHHKQLYNGLLEKGFRLVDFTYRLMDEPINIVNFEAEAKKEFIKSPNNIDISI